MIERLEDFNKYLLIDGFRDFKIESADKFLKRIKEETDNACVQFFDSTLIAGPEHLRFAVLNALNAFRNKLNISSSLSMETLLYASAQAQITNAIDLLGIKSNSLQVAVVIITDSQDNGVAILEVVSKLLDGKRDDSVIKLVSKKNRGLKKVFRISNLELEAETQKEGAGTQALLDLIIEHMALLATEH